MSQTRATFLVTGRTPASTDSVRVRAKDAIGNASAPLALSVTLSAPVGGNGTLTTPPLKNNTGFLLANAGKQRMHNLIDTKLDANTEICATVKDAYTAGRVATKIIKWLGAIAIAGGSIVWAIAEITGQHKGPPGIGPTP